MLKDANPLVCPVFFFIGIQFALLLYALGKRDNRYIVLIYKLQNICNVTIQFRTDPDDDVG